jgi:Ca2+-binding RTX toxin-like protein
MAIYDATTNTYTLAADEVNFTIPQDHPSDAPNPTIIGNALSNHLTGNGGSNILIGGEGADLLQGGGGADRLIGGEGGDAYEVNDTNDIIVEVEGHEGIDTILAQISFTMPEFVEDLVFTGNANLHGTGNALANLMRGNSGNNTLDGAAGADEMVGGNGDDTYIVDNVGDTVTEEGEEGHDTVRASVGFSLEGTTVEDLILTGTAAEGIGNHLENRITGNAIGNTLDGGEGSDTLDGGLGADELIGGLGNDTFVVDNIDDLVTELLGEGNDTIEASVSFTLSDHVENLLLTGSGNIAGTGNNDVNELTGNSGNNRLDGGGGADRMTGRLGNDTYIVDHENDVVIETGDEGHDTVEASVIFELIGTTVEDLILTGSDSINGTGNNLNNKIVGTSGSNDLIGHEGNDTLDGGEGTDNLAGGIGDDTYVLNSEDDVIIEEAGDNNDKVISSITFSLAGTELEHLELTGTALNGTGNAAKNRITGNSEANLLSGAEGDDTLDGGNGADRLEGGSGKDLLIGGAGADVLIGGEGDDDYFVDSAEDVVSEDATGGTLDRVISKINYTLGANVEYLALENGFGNLTGTGNTLNNTIFGNDGNNVIDGGMGTDTLTGASGNDTVYGGDGDDVINEYENGNDFLNGGNGSDQINAEGGNDNLDGGTGADTLKGGAGDDTLYLMGVAGHSHSMRPG